MLFTIFAFLVLIFHGTSSLRCYEYNEQHANDWIDSETLPSTPTNGSVINAKHQCTAMIQWFTLSEGKETFIDYFGDDSFDFLPEGSSLSFVWVSIEYDLQTASTRTLIYSCTTDHCNSRANLQQILNSLTLEEDFAQLDSLLSNDTAKFTEQSSCVDFSNTTRRECPSPASPPSKCRVCFLLEIGSPTELCARCLENIPMAMDVEFIKRQVFFFLQNRTRLADQIILTCRTNGCNALTNIETIHRLSTLEFNFNHSPTNSSIILSTTLNLFIFLKLILELGR